MLFRSSPMISCPIGSSESIPVLLYGALFLSLSRLVVARSVSSSMISWPLILSGSRYGGPLVSPNLSTRWTPFFLMWPTLFLLVVTVVRIHLVLLAILASPIPPLLGQPVRGPNLPVLLLLHSLRLSSPHRNVLASSLRLLCRP